MGWHKVTIMIIIRGHSITTWIWFCPFLTTYLPPHGHFLPWTWTNWHFLTTYPPDLVHVVFERPLTEPLPQSSSFKWQTIKKCTYSFILKPSENKKSQTFFWDADKMMVFFTAGSRFGFKKKLFWETLLFCQGFRMESKLKDKIISKKIERFFKSLKSRLPPRFQKLVPNVSKMSVNLPDFLSRKLFMNKVTVTQFNIGNQY